MSTLRSGLLGLLTPCWILLIVSAPAIGKKPPKDPPPGEETVKAPIEYMVYWLGGFENEGYTSTYANDVNIHGTIVGQVKGNSDGACPSRAVLWQYNGEWLTKDLSTDVMGLDPDEGYLCNAYCISNSGLIAACYRDAAGDAWLCVCDPAPAATESNPYGDPTVTVLGYDAPFSVRDMNEWGIVVGYIVNDADVKQGFVWDYMSGDAGLQLLPETYLASGVNSWGEVVGIINDKFLGGEVFKWQMRSGPVTDAERLGARAELFAPMNGRPAISEGGMVAGTVAVRKRREPRRLLPDGTWELLDVNDFGYAAVNDINTEGQICGNLNQSRYFDPGFVYDARRGESWPLDNRIISEDTGDLWWRDGNKLPRAVADQSDLSCEGFSIVVGWYTNDDGTQGSFALFPVPRPQP